MLRTFLLLLFAIRALPVWAQPADLSTRIDSIAHAAPADGPIAGLSLAVMQGGKMLHAEGYGWADIENQIPATTETIYDIGSVGKILAAVAVLTLVDNGRLDLDAALTTVLPAFPNPEQGRRITLRQLLNHTSGLNDYVVADRERWETTLEPLSPTFVLEYVRNRPLDFEPGTHYSYTNTGFYLAGLIVEHVTGQRWGDYVVEEVARPLGLHSVFLCDDVVDRSAIGYEVIDDGLVRTEGEYVQLGIQGDGGLCANVLDLARLPNALLTSGLLSERSLNELLHPTRLADGVVVDYGLGVARGMLEGRPLWGHLGGAENSLIAAVIHYPEDDITIAVLVNTLFGEVGPLLLEGYVASEVFELGEDVLEAQSASSEILGAYTGEYVRGNGSRFHVVVDDGRLAFIESEGDQPSMHLPYLGNHTFGIPAYPMDRFVFQRANRHTLGYSLYLNGLFTGFHRRIGP